MSYAYDHRKKMRRLMLDERWPDRRRIRRLIRNGIYPRFMFDGLVFDRSARVGPGFHVRVRGWMWRMRMVCTMKRTVDQST